MSKEKRTEMGLEIVRFEGRFKDGKLQVYKLPAGDGGGSYEIAGINERYHPKKALELKKLIEAGHHEVAALEAAEYIIDYTKGVLNFFPNESYADKNLGVEFLLRDSAFNRGLKGAATILQLALGVTVDGAVGPKTKEEFKKQLDADSGGVCHRLTSAREKYERTSYPWKSATRDESSKFWKGLSNRWTIAHTTSQKFQV